MSGIFAKSKNATFFIRFRVYLYKIRVSIPVLCLFPSPNMPRFLPVCVCMCGCVCVFVFVWGVTCDGVRHYFVKKSKKMSKKIFLGGQFFSIFLIL